VVETIVVKSEAVKKTEVEVEEDAEGQTGDRGTRMASSEVNRKLDMKVRVEDDTTASMYVR
jgi:hypothetical protein